MIAPKKRTIEESLRSARLMLERAMQEPPVGEEDRRESQDLAYESWEAPTWGEALDLAEEALELNPHCVDAYLVILDFAELGAPEEIEFLRKVVAVGAEELTRDWMNENRGHFWGILATRPYMRARARLAELLLHEGHWEEAVREYAALIELNPNDNQGLRYGLLAGHLAVGALEAARRLMDGYQEHCAVFCWARVLERVLAKDLEGAGQALKTAMRQNAHVIGYLKDRRTLPRELPDSYAAGSEDEAAVAADLLGRAWARHPRAMTWLRKQE